MQPSLSARRRPSQVGARSHHSVRPAAELGLVGHSTFDEGSGDIVKDLSGHGNEGRVHGATFVPSPRGRWRPV
jgi:hypothetical protein